jgi:hypothetical protein
MHVQVATRQEYGNVDARRRGMKAFEKIASGLDPTLFLSAKQPRLFILLFPTELNY